MSFGVMCNMVINFNLANLSFDCCCHSHPNLQRALPGTLPQPLDLIPIISLNLIDLSSLHLEITGRGLRTASDNHPCPKAQVLEGLSVSSHMSYYIIQFRQVFFSSQPAFKWVLSACDIVGLFLCLYLVEDVLLIDDRQNKKYKRCIKIFIFKKGKFLQLTVFLNHLSGSLMFHMHRKVQKFSLFSMLHFVHVSAQKPNE